MKKEDFKAVDFMRKCREELSLLHKENPEKYENLVRQAREKYAGRFKSAEKAKV